MFCSHLTSDMVGSLVVGTGVREPGSPSAGVEFVSLVRGCETCVGNGDFATRVTFSPVEGASFDSGVEPMSELPDPVKENNGQVH